MSGVERRVLADPAALARAAQELVLRDARTALELRGRFDLVLAGGSTPERLYRALALLAPATFSGWHLWWGDERFVPPDDPASNFGLVQRTLLSGLAGLAWPPERIHPIPTQGLTPAEAARRYERDIEAQLGGAGFDLVLLGLGTDGHTASLFPGSAALDVRGALVASARPEHAPHERVTLTLPALAAARHRVFLVSGADKRATLERLLALARPTSELPASLVRSQRGSTTWLLDRDAAPAGG